LRSGVEEEGRWSLWMERSAQLGKGTYATGEIDVLTIHLADEYDKMAVMAEFG